MSQPHPNASPDPARPSELRVFFAQLDFRPKKRLGQHFLISPQVADRILQAADISPEDRVLEVGAGAGALTVRLARSAAFTIAVELDPQLTALLSELLPDRARVQVLQADILRVELGELLAAGKWKALGNLPYYITGPVLGRLIEQRRSLAVIVVMVQKEVAERIVSPPGSKEYGALSVMAQTFFAVKREMVVKRSQFYPQPEVDSAVVSLTPRAEPPVAPEEEAGFERVVRAAFAHRRKTLENSLLEAGFAGGREAVGAALQAAGVEAGRRAESLSIAEFVRLARELKAGGQGD